MANPEFSNTVLLGVAEVLHAYAAQNSGEKGTDLTDVLSISRKEKEGVLGPDRLRKRTFRIKANRKARNTSETRKPSRPGAQKNLSA